MVAQWYRTPEDEVAEHALMSITKSVVGCAAGILIAQGCLDPDLPAAARAAAANAGTTFES